MCTAVHPARCVAPGPNGGRLALHCSQACRQAALAREDSIPWVRRPGRRLVVEHHTRAGFSPAPQFEGVDHLPKPRHRLRPNVTAMSDSATGISRLGLPRSLVISGATLLVLALVLPWYRGTTTPPIECLRAPCPQSAGTVNGWQAFLLAAVVLTGLAVVQVVLSLVMARVSAAPVLVCLLAVGCVVVIAFALVHPDLQVVTSLQPGFAVALFGCGTSGLGGLSAEIDRRR